MFLHNWDTAKIAAKSLSVLPALATSDDWTDKIPCMSLRVLEIALTLSPCPLQFGQER